MNKVLPEWDDVGFRQRCKVCNRSDHFNFHIDDEVWLRVLPKHYAEAVVCLACFDYFASAKGIPYHHALKDVIFVGDIAHFDFDITRRETSFKMERVLHEQREVEKLLKQTSCA